MKKILDVKNWNALTVEMINFLPGQEKAKDRFRGLTVSKKEENYLVQVMFAGNRQPHEFTFTHQEFIQLFRF